jgi:REP element-mobilizing transposase RayT
MPRYEADPDAASFCTITILEWLPLLIDRRYIDPIIESFGYCRHHKGLRVFAFVVMPNHLHFVDHANTDLHAVIRDFKRFTARRIHDLLKEEGRATPIRWLENATEPARRLRGELGLWQPGFHPQAVRTREVLKQKTEYIHMNPVRKGLVANPEDWWYSSAGEYVGREPVCMSVDHWDG